MRRWLKESGNESNCLDSYWGVIFGKYKNNFQRYTKHIFWQENDKMLPLHLSTCFTSVQSKGSKLVTIILMENWWILQMMWMTKGHESSNDDGTSSSFQKPQAKIAKIWINRWFQPSKAIFRSRSTVIIVGNFIKDSRWGSSRKTIKTFCIALSEENKSRKWYLVRRRKVV